MKKDKAVRRAEMKAAVIKQLKSLIVPMILFLIILGGVLVISLYKTEEVPEEIVQPYAFEAEPADIIIENDQLKLVMDNQTTQFKVIVKKTGKEWYSNPEGISDDTIALPSEKDRLNSTILMTYSTANGVDTLYNNYTYSIANKIYEIESGDDFIKVKYSMGEVKREFVIPTVITVERMMTYLDKLDGSDKKVVTDYYKKYDVNKLSDNDKKNIDEILENYPIVANEPCYVLRGTTKDNLKGKIESILEKAGYTYEDFLADKENDLSTSVNEKPVFNVSMIYRLEGNDLVVEIPMDEMESKKKYPIYYLSPLPYFGAGTKSEDGYLMVPEGGGALINFNNGKVSQSKYYANLYGWDMAQDREGIVHETETYFNAYGIAKDGASFLCMLEDGASYAGIYADVSGKQNSYNYVYAQYGIWHRDSYEMGTRANNTIYVYQDHLPEGEILKQRYSFINSDKYTDMALCYRDHLLKEFGDYLTANTDSSAPVALEIVGAIDKIKQVVGVPVSRPLELTKFKEAQNMLAELTASGLQNVSVKYTGWMNGGVQQRILEKAKIVSSLGSKKDLNNLVEYAKANGIDIYLEGITNYAYDSDIFDGFFILTDSAKFTNKKKAAIYPYSTVTFAKREKEDPHYLLKPSIITEMIENLAEVTKKYGTGVAFKDVGKDLSSNYDKKDLVSREAAKLSQIASLKAIKDSGQNIMVNTGNNYAVGYYDFITNMDLNGSVYTIIDSTAPIYQMAIHGYINYTGDPLNLAENKQEELLKSAEYGAGLQFTLMDETSFTLQNTLYTEYFGAEYDACKKEVIEIYNRYNSELGHTFNQKIVDHKNISKEVACTTYEDGTKVYVNYSFEPMKAENGITVPARDYLVVK